MLWRSIDIVFERNRSCCVLEFGLLEISKLSSDYNLKSAEVSVSTDRNLDWISQ